MKIEIPIEFDDVLIEIVTQNVIQALQESKKVDFKIEELPQYPNRKQVKRILKIGDGRLNQWIAIGLKVIPFGKEIRFDREDIQKFLNQLKL
ncbi:DNA-binding protein [Enterococcus faecalis]|uniref:helix-turn-helix domain-containing protein n=1 Tax=Enterococcus faecalis TaxID=1351 RepID=UPI00115DC356|nr:helix-turn-helix domain-containing protein [Enterococcus faecalis]EGO5828681.1 helix-turn-helix domain-containing protein [Enterococcus faecalis]EGO5830124.1 helix-turn-helix domain-containing protein [Enterococcus faecalis]EGO6035785.1 helix-turn-helix domain-containing protein [Enterococcus faecalis]EGO6036497.1 helix-turn-helix domain-containing protein [Enterococcus faecalis]EHU9648789.1 DNA-binding protein [Enterococcus faecalis]